MNNERLEKAKRCLQDAEQLKGSIVPRLTKDKAKVQKVLNENEIIYEIFSTGPEYEITGYNLASVDMSKMDPITKNLIKSFSRILNEMNLSLYQVGKARKKVEVCVRYNDYTKGTYEYVLSSKINLESSISRYNSILEKVLRM